MAKNAIHLISIIYFDLMMSYFENKLRFILYVLTIHISAHKARNQLLGNKSIYIFITYYNAIPLPEQLI